MIRLFKPGYGQVPFFRFPPKQQHMVVETFPETGLTQFQFQPQN
jgi:hypothetical protein